MLIRKISNHSTSAAVPAKSVDNNENDDEMLGV